MISVVYTAVCEGIEGIPVQVETDIGPGLPQINIVGLASTTVMESRERIKSGLLNSGFEYPRRRVTVNLIPAGIRKNGSHLDLAIAMGILGAMGYADADALREIGFIGEISLQGDVCRVEGVLPMILGMEKAGIRRVVLPAENLAEAELAREGGSAGPELLAVRNLQECLDAVQGKKIPSQGERVRPAIRETEYADFSDISGQENAKRAAVVHLMFNVIGVAVLLTVFCIVKAIFAPVLLNNAASMAGIAVAHSVFNILCTAILLPCGGLLEKLAVRLVPDKAQAEETVELDERLLATPSLALQRCRAVACDMAAQATLALQNALRSLEHYTPELAASIREDESRCDHYEDVLGTYLVKLSARKMGDDESEEAAELLKAIGDFERISDHAVNVLESAEELRDKELSFSDAARRELSVLTAAVDHILTMSLDAFRDKSVPLARQVEPLEEVIDGLKEQLRTRHILRMQQGQCSIEAGFVLSDLLTDLERTSDHCSNIAGCVIDAAHHDLNLHATLDAAPQRDPDFPARYKTFAEEYKL